MGSSHPSNSAHSPDALTARAPARLDGLRMLFFGLGGVFSRLPLEALQRAGADIRAVVTPAQSGLAISANGQASGDAPFLRLEPPARRMSRLALPLMGAAAPARSLRDLAAASDAPLLSVSRLNDPVTLEALAAFEPDVICVACFTRRLPPALLALPRLGCLNAHPSLLPCNRGPDPLFWTFHVGMTETGVTIHLMDARLDTGPIVAQSRTPLREGESEAALEARLAALAGGLMVEALAGLRAGAITPRKQDETRATTHSWPVAEDYHIPASWPARRAYTFASGVVERGEPVTITAADGARFRLIEPLGYDPTDAPDFPWRLDGDRLRLTCAPGVFTCRAVRDEK
ncbi:MAG TPA: formyltransferase family protein [Ktedonobacterales bacterium]